MIIEKNTMEKALLAFTRFSCIFAIACFLMPSLALDEVFGEEGSVGQGVHSDLLQREKFISFPLNDSFLQGEGVQYYYSFLRKRSLGAWGDFNEDDKIDEGKAAPANLIKMLLLDRLDQHTRDFYSYHIQILKSAYLVDIPYDEFREKNIFDMDYLRHVLEHGRVERKKEESRPLRSKYRFHDRRSFHPSFTFWLYDLRTYLPREVKGLLRLFGRKMNHKNTSLDFITYQRSFDFDRVMGQRTGEEAITVSFHTPYKGGEQSLVKSYSLQYLHSHPPGLFGGIEKLFEQTREGIIQTVGRIRKYHRSP